MSISFAATPQSKEAQQARTYTDPSAGAPPSRRSGYDKPYVDLGHWNKVFTDQSYFDSIAKQKGMAEGAKVSLFGDDYVYRQAMIGYLADTRNVPVEDMRKIFDAEKDGFAKKVLGKQTASAREMFDWQKSKFERDNEKQAAARQILNNVAQRAITDFATGGDTPFVESVAKDIDAAGDMFSEEEKSMLWQQAEENDIKLRATQMRFAPEAKFIFDALRQTTGEGAGFGAPDMREMATRFAKLPDNQRRAIYELAGSFAQLNQTDKGFWYQLAESLGRGASDIVERVPRNMKEQALRNDLRLLEGDQPVFAGTGVQGVAYSAFGTKALTPEEREQAADKVRGELGIFKVERELRDLAERVIDPIKTVTVLPEIVEEGLYGAARSLPYTAVAAIPYAGAPAVAAALYSSNYDRIMLEYPDIDPDKAALIAAISAPIEAGLERMKVNTIMGRLPFFGGLVKRFQHPNQRNITRIAIGGAGVLAEQNAQEILQNATFPFVQMIGAALDQDIPEYKLDLAGMPRDLAVQFVALLPLSLMGIGALSYREISRGEAYLRSKENLEKAGYSEDQIDRITGADTADEAQSILREESKKRDPKLLKAAAQRIVDESIALREKANPVALPRLEKQGADYVVLSPEGKELARERDQTAAEQALVSARRETVQREMRDVHNGINFAMEWIRRVSDARDRGEDITQLIREVSGRTLFTDYEANPSKDNLDRLFETARVFGGDPKEPEDLKMFPVIGSNQGALREGIWRSIIRINEGADGTIVMREFAQDNLKRALAENRVTMDWVREKLNELLPQIESDRIERRLRTETDTDVIEAFSDVAVAYFRGQIREEQIPEGLRGFFRRMAIVMADIFRRAYNLARLRAEGKLDRDFEALLAEAVGVDQQALVDRSREKTAQEVAPETANYSIGVTSQQDADYLAAVERGDMETAQRMVDEAALAAGYDTEVFRSNETVVQSFDTTGRSAWFTNDLSDAEDYASMTDGEPPPVQRYYIDTDNFADLDDSDVADQVSDIVDDIDDLMEVTEKMPQIRERLREQYDGISVASSGMGYMTVHVNPFHANAIKSADPITRDSQGNVIPLSQRFDTTTANINYSIVRSVDHFKNDTRFDKLVKDGRVFTGVDVNDFTDMHILLHSPDNAFAGTIQLKDGSEIKGKGGVYYPALYADDNYFWASTEAMVMRTANHLNEIGAKNGGRILMGLVSAPVEKLFSSTSMATGVVKFLNALTTDSKAGLRKSDLNAMLVAASKVEVIVPSKTKESKKTFKLKLKASDSYATNIAKIDQLLEPSGSIFQVRKAFVESLAEQVSKHLNATPDSAAYVAGILADAENKHAKNAIRRGKLSKASFLQGLGNMLTEPFLRDFQEHGSGKIYAIVEVEGRVKGIATTEHESYPATIVPVDKKSKVKLHVLKEAVDWQDVVGKETGQYATPQERLNLLPTSGMSSTSLKVLGVKAGSSANLLNYSIAAAQEQRKADVAITPETPVAKSINGVSAEDIFASAKERFGITNSIYEAGYVLPDGTMLDFSGRSQASGYERDGDTFRPTNGQGDYMGGSRKVDHREIEWDGMPQYTETWGSMADFLRLGAVRIDGNSGTISMRSRLRPTSAQISVLKDLVTSADGAYLDLEDDLGNGTAMMLESGKWTRVHGFLERWANGETPTVTRSYSISTQSEIDRVGAALNRLERSPSERIAIYKALKERVNTAIERNRPTMTAMREDQLPEGFDRTQMLNELGMLDYVLRVLPPEVRGRVGGYVSLASIQPMDVYKGDERVSQTKNMAGAIISAWMREGLNIGQAQKKTELPEGYTAIANTDPQRRDRVLADFFIDRLKVVDRELERYLKGELVQAIIKAAEKARPKAGESGVRRSTLGPETQKFADMVYRATLLDEVKVAERLIELETAIASQDLTSQSGGDKRAAQLSEEWTIVNTFGDLKNRSSETLAYGLEWLQTQLQAGREAWNIKETARIEANRERAAKALLAIGKPTDTGRFENKDALVRFLQGLNAYDLDHKSFEQVVVTIFGAVLGEELSTKFRKADIAVAKQELADTKVILDALKEGAKQAGISRGKALQSFKENVTNAVRKLEGRKVKDTRIAIDLAKKIVRGMADRGSLTKSDVETLADELAALPRDTKKEFVTIKQVVYRGDEVRLTMSRAQAMQLWLSWNQPDIQDKMRREGWTDDSAADLENMLSGPVSQAMLRVASKIYGAGSGMINPVYSRMFGMELPAVRNYAPARFLNAKDVKDVSLDGSPVTAGGQPSFAKSRVTHSAKIAPEDGMIVLQSHISQRAHWVNFAELAREFRSLLSTPDVRDAIRQQYGDDVLNTVDSWGDQMEQRGANKGREIAWINKLLGMAIGGQSVALLGLNLKSLAMQTDNLMRFFLALDSKQIANALGDPAALAKAIRTVWNTDIIQTRLEGGATAETRFLFTKFVSMFQRGSQIAELAMKPMNYTDSAGLTLSGAVVYVNAYNDAIESGMKESMADAVAKDAVEAMVYRYGQPVLMGQKSNIENTGNVFAKTFFLFMSDPRLKAAIIADSVRGLATGRGNWKDHVRRIVAIEMMALVSHVLATAFRDLTSDDDDEDLWSMGGFARALLLAPLQGYFFLGSVSDLILSRLTEAKWFIPTQDPFIRMASTADRAFRNLDDAVNFDDPDALVKEWTNISRAIAVTPSLAAPAVILNVIRPLVQAWERMDDDQ